MCLFGVCLFSMGRLVVAGEEVARGGGGRLGFNVTQMCVSKREGHGSLFGPK